MAGVTSQVTKQAELPLEELGLSLAKLRLCPPEAHKQMQLSLATLGQLAPVQACRVGTGLELFDGLKRWHAARALSWASLRVEVHALDMTGAKVRLLGCNAPAGLSHLEEAWVVRSLYRDDALTQPQIARLLGRDKAWVCRRLILAEGLSDELGASVRLGLVSPTAAVALARLQRCNQEEVAQVVTRRGLTSRQTARLVDKLLATPQTQWPGLLNQAGPPSTSPAPCKGGAPRRTPAEQLMADTWTMKRVAARLHARLLERSLASLGDPACLTAASELADLNSTLLSLTKTLTARLQAQGATSDA